MQPFRPADEEDDLPPLLRNRPRRTGFSEPPAGYFDALPAQVLTRIRETQPPPRRVGFEMPALTFSWPRLRLALASATLSTVFIAAFWLSRPTGSVISNPDTTLATVNQQELVEYLADPATSRLYTADLTALSSTENASEAELLNVPLTEIDAALDELPLDESYL